MGLLPPFLRRLSSSAVTRVGLRGCDRVGEGAHVVGSPRIVNEGQILIGKRFRFMSEPVMSHLFAENGGIIEIADDVSIGHGSGIAARGRIHIGNGCRLGAFVLAMDTDYHVAGETYGHAEVNPIEIGERVRIGNRVTILRGSTIGDGAVISDGSVVSGSVPAGARVAGVPARAVRSDSRPDSGETLELRVQRVAQDTFRLAQLPPLASGPADVEAWDSLGMLSFLLALEEEFGMLLAEDQMRDIHSLFDVKLVISSALERR